MSRPAMLVTAVLFALLAFAPPIAAQDVATSLRPGDRVRATYDGRRVEGEFVALDDSLRLAVIGREIAVAPEDATERGRQRPRGRGMLRGAGFGLLIGGVGGGVAGLASGDDPPGFFSFTREEKALLLGGVFGVTGIVVGGVVGLISPGREWEELRLSGVRVGLFPVEGGVGFVVEIAR